MEDKMTEQQHLYFQYIEEHINNVINVWNMVIGLYPNFKTYDIIQHDKSKYSDKEFDGYRQYFYPKPGQEKDINYFNFAWNHHQKTNPHHWEFWLLIKITDGVQTLTPIEIPQLRLIEMLCDWTAMSIKFKNLPSEWYNKNKNNMLIHPNSQKWLEDQLFIFDKVYKDINGIS